MSEYIDKPVALEKLTFRYALINKEMKVEKIEEGFLEKKINSGLVECGQEVIEADPFTMIIHSDNVQVGFFYDPIKEIFSAERDPQAIATYEDLLKFRSGREMEETYATNVTYLEKNRDSLLRSLEEIDEKLKYIRGVITTLVI